jgi:uncharacterized UPF0160 family protein
MKKVVIAVHNSIFHVDEIFAVAVLSMLYDGNIKVIRTRDQKTLDKADFRIDVGGRYCPETGDYDHHQSGGAGIRNNGVPYASFGLIWKQFGDLLCEDNLEIASIIDQKLVQPIDASDNKYRVLTSGYYRVIPFTISEIIANLNPEWNESQTDEDYEESFNAALSMAILVLKRQISCAKSLSLAETPITKALRQAEDKRILAFDKHYPWQKALAGNKEVLFVIFPVSQSNDWGIQCATSNNSHSLFPENWAGKKGQELQEASGVNGAIFCHNKRFFATASNQEAAILLAKTTLLANKS